jgi:hypothetical protein
MKMDKKLADRLKREANGFRSGLRGKDNPLSRMRGGRSGVHAFANPKERRLAALHMYYDRMHGARMEELQKNYKLSYPIINRMLKEIMSDDLVKKLEQQILEDVVPMAINVYKTKLSEGSEYVAKDVLQNFAKIADRNIKREELKKQEEDDEDSLEFLMRIKGKIRPQIGPQEVFEHGGDIIEGTVVGVGSSQQLSGRSESDFSEQTGLEEAVKATVREDFEGLAAGIEPERAPILGKTIGSGRFPTRARAVNGDFVSIRDILRGKLEEDINNE